jgi:hypothetical protein
MEELRKRKIFLATPMYGGACSGMFTKSVAELSAECTKAGIALQQFFLFNESLITRARNYCADEFMRSDSTHLMFIDSDIGFSAKDVIAMLAMMGDDSEYDVMCGPYPKKTISWEKVKKAVDKGFADDVPNNLEKYVGDFVFNPKSGSPQIPIDRPVEILEGGTGFMMIKRRVFDGFLQHYPSLAYRPDHVRSANFDGTRFIHAYFDCVIDRGYSFDDMKRLVKSISESQASESVGKFREEAKELLSREEKNSMRYLSEDYMFNQYVQKIGFKVWLCPWMKLQHVGSYVFSGSLFDLAQVGASATASLEEIRPKKKGKK